MSTYATNATNAPHAPNTSAFEPILIGVTPAGSEWVAYKPEHIEPMRRRFAMIWERFEAKRAEQNAPTALRVELGVDSATASPAVVRACASAAQTIARDFADGQQDDIAPGVVKADPANSARATVAGTSRFLAELAGVLFRLADLLREQSESHRTLATVAQANGCRGAWIAERAEARILAKMASVSDRAASDIIDAIRIK